MSEDDQPRDEEREDEPKRRWPGVRESVRTTAKALAPVGKRRVVMASVTLAGVALGAILIFSGISFWWTSQPSFCGRCHVMTPFIQAWEKSPHREVNCENCHLNPGLFGFLGGKISSLQVVLNYVRGEYEDWSFNAAVPNASCLQCHEEILEHNVHSSGIRVSHANIIGMGGKCISCHSTVAHGSEVPVGSETHPTMAACLKCHDNETAPLKCNLCHISRPGGQKAAAEQGAPAEG